MPYQLHGREAIEYAKSNGKAEELCNENELLVYIDITRKEFFK